ncbi:HCL113Cp [Eremothecium sinecaudum]|uniref:Lysophospholipase n=1 Tax=Eremothecium sinecaudum TaxID=45286 RepID=A0A109UYS6_9SACH|nr:HCL113Cp [Eremothecium sinecaudum]AMD20038.1 HCL113Cp [Eremothecium sinecaudum]
MHTTSGIKSWFSFQLCIKGLSSQEATYVRNHHYLTQNHLVKFLQKVNIPEFNMNEFLRLSSNSPANMATAVSGGGYRSMLTSSGFLLGMQNYGLFDVSSYIASISGGSWTVMKLLLTNFNISELQKWNIGSSLLEGVPNFEFQNREIIQQLDAAASRQEVFMDDAFYNELKEHATVWKRKLDESNFDSSVMDVREGLDSIYKSSSKLDKRSLETLLKFTETLGDVFKGNNDTNTGTHDKKLEDIIGSFSSFRKVLGFYINLHSEVRPKKIMGFPVSFTDYWGRALWKKIYNKSASSSMSKLFEQSESVKKFSAPVPIIIANCKNEEQRNIVFEFTPFEFGSWNKLLKLFVKLRYLGSKIVKGTAQSCVEGFDDIGFITATSSSLFNNVLIYAWQLAADSSQETVKAIRALFSTFGVNLKNRGTNGTSFGTRSDFALFQPNPFLHYVGVDSPLTRTDKLYLVDGGEDGENIPLRPFLQPERNIDVIFALDSSSGKQNYPTGSILRNLYENIHHYDESATILGPNGNPLNVDLMPYIPRPEEFKSLRLLEHPVAFGCYPSSYSPRNSSVSRPAGKLPPIIFYHSNKNLTYNSNTSTFKLSYSLKEVSGMLSNGWEIFINKKDTSYLQCVGCIIIKRIYDNTDTTNALPLTCQRCYKKYCYN